VTAPSGSKRLYALLAVLAAIAAYTFWPRGAAPSVSGPPVSTGGAKPVALDPNQVPTFNPDRSKGGPIEGKVGRNIFRYYNSPTPTPTNTPPPPTPTRPIQGPNLPTATPTSTPIIPPKIPYTAMGIMGAEGNRIVVLEEGGRLINAREGDVIDNRFKVLKINRESVDFGFPDLPKSITSRLPVQGAEGSKGK
jgi:hypothetical protein